MNLKQRVNTQSMTEGDLPLLFPEAPGLSVNTAAVYRLVNSNTVNMIPSADDKTSALDK